ncbi:MAG: hypothetical protein ACFBSE_07870 [Prochloraceae cyanobacterium]
MKDFFSGIPQIDKIKSTIGDRISKIDSDRISNVSAFYPLIDNFAKLSPEQQQELIAIAKFLAQQKDLNKRDIKEWEKWRDVRKIYRDLLIKINNIKS